MKRILRDMDRVEFFRSPALSAALSTNGLRLKTVTSGSYF